MSVYFVESMAFGGWSNAEWMDGDKPLVFNTWEDAQEEINQFIKEVNQAYKDGNIHRPYYTKDYRVKKQKDRTNVK